MENKLDFKAYVLDIEYSPSNVMQGMAQPSEQLIQLYARNAEHRTQNHASYDVLLMRLKSIGNLMTSNRVSRK